MADEHDKVELSTDEARAGTTPHMTRYILPVSMVLVIVVFAFLLFTRL
ncbi:hypothetical protein [Sphingomonas sp.]|jgi:hypothetical protein|nr:hypothetical protein [Sphingomonas sp.]MDF2495210.1 hypothetical protein [Sphingomonas sp.]